MIKLNSDNWSELPGKGWMAYFEKNKVPEGLWTPVDLRDQTIDIDGKHYEVRAVEMFMIGGVSPNSPYNLPFGLLVREVTNEAELDS